MNSYGLQIAGDEMPGPAADYVTRLAGLGFQALGPQFRKGAAGEAKAKADELEDRVDTLSRGILGLTVSCARCHDHKFDPIPTRDYYSLASAYNGADWPNRMLAAPEVVDAHNQWRGQVDQQTAGLKKWREDQAKSIGRKALEQADRYASAACRILLQRKRQQTLDEAAFAPKEGLQIHFVNRWLKAIEESKGEPLFDKLRDAVTQTVEAQTSLDGNLFSQQAEEIKKVVQVALDALRASEQPAKDPAQPAPGVSPENEKLLTVLWKDAKAPFFVAENEIDGLLAEAEKQQLTDLQNQLAKLTSNPAPSGPMMPSIKGGGQAMQVFVQRKS